MIRIATTLMTVALAAVLSTGTARAQLDLPEGLPDPLDDDDDKKKPADKPRPDPKKPQPKQPQPEQPDTAAPLRDRAPIATDKLRPWAEGVPTEKQTAALELFQEGNKLLRDRLFIKAAELYREALENWDHPAIHYNLALSLITLDEPAEVYQSLERAMAFGPEPLEAENFQRAINYKTLVAKLLAKVEIVCEVPEAVVSLDGATLFTGPGRWSALVRIGEHSIVAQKEGYVPTNETRRFAPEEEVKIKLKLYTIAEVTSYRRRWAPWKPLAVLGGGAAVAALGGIFHLRASSNMTSFNSGIEACGGCVPDSSLSKKKTTAQTQEVVAYISYGVGITVLATGAVLAYINREMPYQIEPGADASPRRKVSLVPVIGPGQAGVAASISF